MGPTSTGNRSADGTGWPIQSYYGWCDLRGRRLNPHSPFDVYAFQQGNDEYQGQQTKTTNAQVALIRDGVSHVRYLSPVP